MAPQKIGILTAGGDCPGLNAVIRAVVKRATNEYGMSAIGFIDGFRGMVTDESVPLDYERVSHILDLGGTILGSSNRDNPFKFYYDDRQREPLDESAKAVATYRRHGLDALVCIGGDGTLSMSHQLTALGLNIVGVPKTIDNDVQGTDQTFGFDSAVATASWAIDRLRTTAASHHRVMVVELMGRTAGWLTLMAGIAGGGDAIIIPEIPYTMDALCDMVARRNTKGRRYSIICVAEGARERGGAENLVEGKDKRTGMVRFGGIAAGLAEAIEERTGIESRATVLGHIQRGGSPTPFDRILATRYGSHATELVHRGIFGVTACLRGNAIEHFPLERVANNPRLVDPQGEMVRVARAVGTCMGD